MDIYFASNNTHKLKEMQNILPQYQFIMPATCGIDFNPEETGSNFFENAMIKARALYALVHKPVLADDSGLCIHALNGAPGIHSARYAKTSTAANERVLKELEGVRERCCYFACCMIFMRNEYSWIAVQEILEGEIAHSMRGVHGFGYDPIVYLPQYKKTLAELSEAEKNICSHRARAAQALKKILAY